MGGIQPEEGAKVEVRNRVLELLTKEPPLFLLGIALQVILIQLVNDQVSKVLSKILVQLIIRAADNWERFQ